VPADNDAPRFMAAASERGYTHYAKQSLDPSAEVVPPEFQAELTRRSHAEWDRSLRRRWGEAAQTINGVLDDFVASSAVRNDNRLRSSLRAVRRSVDAVGRSVGSQ
jgi:hypothetical protein